MFANANNVRIQNGNFTIVNQVAKSTVDVLHQRVAPNAILNKGGRVDDAKCHPGTREEVIDLIERWMNDSESDRIFWMSGPAGGGKTAIMKTVVERSADRGVQTINFFFFRGDSTRNSAQPVVATLLYQLFQLYPASSEVAARIISERPRILDESTEEQCELISALFPIIQQLSPAPIILLIDGLDECDIDAERSQHDVLCAFERLVRKDRSPFRLLVASRREPRIQMCFNQLRSHARSIFLDEEYSPKSDIRIFVQAEFHKIKSSHPSKRFLPSDWPATSDVEAIVTKSTGQFIYAAFVMRYISHPATVPTLSLDRVMGIVPTVTNSPFINLDNMYFFILNQASDPDATRDILSMNLLFFQGFFRHTEILRHYDSRYNAALIESCISELSAIVQLNGSGYVEYYHASLTDFLLDRSRSGPYWVDVNAYMANMLLVLWKRNMGDHTHADDDLMDTLLINLRKPTPEITHMLLNETLPDWLLSRLISVGNGFDFLRDLYYLHDVKTYNRILRRLIFTIMSRNGGRLPQYIGLRDMPHAQEHVSSYQKRRWWFQLVNIIHRKKDAMTGEQGPSQDVQRQGAAK